MKVSFSPVFCRYQVYDIFNMSCLGGDTPGEGHDGMSTLQNRTAAYSQFHISRVCQGDFPLPSL